MQVAEGPPDVHSDTTAASILENVLSVSKEFLSNSVPSSLGTVSSLHLVEAHLSVVVQSSCSSESLLPDKEVIPPNQHTWTKTAQQMGAQLSQHVMMYNFSLIITFYLSHVLLQLVI